MPRLQGSKNKLTAEIKQRISDALNNTIDNLESDMNSLPTNQRLELFARLLPFILPKLKDTELNTINENQNPNEIVVHIVK
jgi:hypothetical protein